MRIELGRRVEVVWRDITASASGNVEEGGLTVVETLGHYAGERTSQGTRCIALAFSRFPHDADDLEGGTGYIYIPRANVIDIYNVERGDKAWPTPKSRTVPCVPSLPPSP